MREDALWGQGKVNKGADNGQKRGGNYQLLERDGKWRR